MKKGSLVCLEIYSGERTKSKNKAHACPAFSLAHLALDGRQVEMYLEKSPNGRGLRPYRFQVGRYDRRDMGVRCPKTALLIGLS